MSSDILKDDFQSLEALRSAFPTFIRDYAMWKRCYSADNSSWSTAEFHSNCDFKGPSLTVIRVREYVFGGFVEQSWGGRCCNRIRSLWFKQSRKIILSLLSSSSSCSSKIVAAFVGRLFHSRLREKSNFDVILAKLTEACITDKTNRSNTMDQWITQWYTVHSKNNDIFTYCKYNSGILNYDKIILSITLAVIRRLMVASL